MPSTHELHSRSPQGAGIGLRTAHYDHILQHGVRDAGWFEVISENFFEPGGRPWLVLDRIRREVPIVLHGVAMGIGNADPLSDSYLRAVEELARRTEPSWISDHLCWGAVAGRQTHDLLPLPFTEEAIAHVVERVRVVQDRLQRRILLENVSSYLTFRDSDMTEWEFIGEVAARADCNLLLDINNIHVNARNHGFSSYEYLDAIDPKRVAQIHLAGHTDFGTYILDSHVGPVPPSVWDLYRRAVRRFGHVPALVEWDTDTPDYATVLTEARRAAEIEREELGHVAA
jgi:uncharacterized protein (UPF0276 family)